MSVLTPGDRDFFDLLPRFDGLLARLSELSPRAPVFLKLKPTRDEGVLREIVAIADAYPFVAGFSINLPAGKPADLRLSASPERLEGMPGAVGGRPVEELINDHPGQPVQDHRARQPLRADGRRLAFSARQTPCARSVWSSAVRSTAACL